MQSSTVCFCFFILFKVINQEICSFSFLIFYFFVLFINFEEFSAKYWKLTKKKINLLKILQKIVLNIFLLMFFFKMCILVFFAIYFKNIHWKKKKYQWKIKKCQSMNLLDDVKLLELWKWVALSLTFYKN